MYVGTAMITMSHLSLHPKRVRAHYARPGHVYFNERSHKLVTLMGESFGC